MQITEFRTKYPQYNDMSDDELTRRLHAKDYSDMRFGEFSVKFGSAPAQQVRPIAEALTATRERILAEPREPGVGPGFEPFVDPAYALPVRPLTKQEIFVGDLRTIRDEPGAPEQKEEKARIRTRARLNERVSEIQAIAQDPITRRRLQENEEDLKGKFLSKAYRRWERGEIMVVGGGLFLADTLTKLRSISPLGTILAETRAINTINEWGRLMHQALQEPEMQPVIENTFDKYFGGAVETGPFLGAAIGSAALTGGATIPASVAGFLVAYGVEGNNIYQTALDQGKSEREARMRGIVGGVINGGIEVAGGGGAKYLKAARLSTIKKLGKARYFGRRVLHTALKEGLMEEMPQELVGMVLGGDPPRNPDGSIDYDATAWRLIDAGIMGTILGGAIDAPMSAYGITKLPALDKGIIIDIGNGRTAIPGVVYTEANIIAEESGNAINPWIKQDVTTSNKGRTLIVQFARSKNPFWVGEVNKNIPNSDLYEIRDAAEAKTFLTKSGYDHVIFNALEIDRKNIEALTGDFKGQTSISGDVGLNFFEPLPMTVLYHGTRTDIPTLQKEGIVAQKPTYSISATDDLETAKTYGEAVRVVIPPAVRILDLTIDENEITIIKAGFPPSKGYDPSSENPVTRKQQLVGLDKLSAKQKKWLTDNGYAGIKFPQTTVGMPGRGTETRFTDTIPPEWIEPLVAGKIKIISDNIKVYDAVQTMVEGRGLKYEVGRDDSLLGESEKPSSEIALMDATDVFAKLSEKYTNKQIEIGYREWVLSDQGRFEFSDMPARRDITKEIFARLLLSDSPYTTAIMEKVLAKTKPAVDETIGAQFGLTPIQVQDILVKTENRYRLLKGKDVNKRSREDKKELAFLSRNRGDIEALVDDFTSDKPVVRDLWKKPKKLSKKELLRRGHSIPEQMNMTEEIRRDLQEKETGKRSMAEMSKDELAKWVNYIEAELAARGEIYVDRPPVLDQMIERLETTAKVPMSKIRNYLKKSRIGGLWTDLKRIERWIEALDGYEEGPLYQHIWKRVKRQDEFRNVNIGREQTNFFNMIGEQNIDSAIWCGRKETIREGLELTPFQQIGVYLLNENKQGHKYLNEGMAITDEDIALIADKLNEEQLTVAAWLDGQYKAQWSIIEGIAKFIKGIDPKLLKQELNYSPIIRVDLAEGEGVSFVDLLLRQFNADSLKPEKGFLEQRKDRAIGKIELDASMIYMKYIQRAETFKAMAQMANDLGKVFNDPQFKTALNNATDKRGVKVMNTWLRDTVRGFMSGPQTEHAKLIAIMRRNGIIYAIGYNVPSVMRQTLSLQNAIAVDPLMLKYVPANLYAATVDYKIMEEFVDSRTNLRSTREYARDLRKKWDASALGKRLVGKKPWSEKATNWIKWTDNRTVTVAWKSLYEVALEKGMDEQTAIEFADKWITRTQPMANMKDLPHFFRGGTIERLISTFQNQINNNLNFYMHDIIGMKIAGKISNTEVGYRVFFSYVFPAILFGIIGRGGLPMDEGRISLKKLAIDLTTYPIATLMLVGRLINRMIRGWGNSSTIGEIAPEEAIKIVKAVKRGDIPGVIKHAAATIGAATGKIPAQFIRIGFGAYDLAAGTTRDPRRLIYSQWALDQEKPTTLVERKRGPRVRGPKVRKPKIRKSG